MRKCVILGVVILGLSSCAGSTPETFGNGMAANTASSEVKTAASVNFASAKPERIDTPKVERVGAVVSGDKRGVAPATTDSLQASMAAIAAVSTPGAASYKIGPQDVIEISVFKVPELSKAAQVSEAGTVNLPLIGEVNVSGKTAREFEKQLTQQLGARYLQNPQVTVFVKEYNSQRITVEGAVKRPGVLPIQGSMSLLQAVAMSQGLEEMSDDTVLVFRNSNGVRKAARFDVSDIRTGAAEDPQLMAGDVVVAGTSALKKNFNSFLKILPVAGLFTFL
jgi:polysaccharide export outer membrane protein